MKIIRHFRRNNNRGIISKFSSYSFSNKSQIKMMETISVLLVFLILLTFVVIFYVSLSSSGSSSRIQDISSLNSIAITQIVSSLPEFQCSFKNIITENCFDLTKVNAFNQYVLNTQEGQRALGTVYFDLFKYSKIEISEIYPFTSSILVYEKEPDKPRFDQRRTYVPISLYNPVDNKYYFGILNITVYT
jgi:hypothetical protein